MNYYLRGKPAMMKLWLVFVLFFVVSYTSVDSLDLRPNCGFPGKPFRAKLSPEEKLVYADGEVVSYQCTDYWAAPQERKCVNGAWTGHPARCGDSIRDVLMKDSRTIDMSATPAPRELWHHTDMNITSREWKYPNAFTSHRFKKARLRITDDHEYYWYFNFTKPVVKMFVKTNFNFINFTYLPESVKKAHIFDIKMEISPHRTCVLEYQNYNPWHETGNRIDSYFACEANSPEDLKLDSLDPPNYMFMSTKSSHKLTHEFIALFFGKAYFNNDSEPLCGEPEVNSGQSSRPNVEYKDYIIDCASKDDWANVDQDNKFTYSIKCTGEMVWNGTKPDCVPLHNKVCPLDDIFWRSMTQNRSTEQEQMALAGIGSGTGNTLPHAESGGAHKSHPKLAVDSLNGYYHYPVNDTIYATFGSELTYLCLDQENYILVGKDTRKCRSDGSWSGTEPTCRFFESSNKLIESSNSLLVAIFIMGILLVLIIAVSCILFFLYTRRLRKKKAELEAEKAEVNAWQADVNLYDNIELNGSGGGQVGGGGGGGGKSDGIYEVYEHIDEGQYSTVGNEYTPYNDPGYNSYSYTTMQHPGHQAGHHYGNLPGGGGRHQLTDDLGTYEELTDGAQSDYVRMLRDSQVFPNHQPVQLLQPSGSVLRNQGGAGGGGGSRVVIVRKDSLKKFRDAEPSYLEISK